MGFYLTLCSKDVSSANQKENSYLFQLPRRFTSPKKLEVALIEISYPTSFNVFTDENESKVGLSYLTEFGQYISCDIILPLSYINILQLINTFNEYVSEYTKNVSIVYDSNDQKVEVNVKDSSIRLSKKLTKILGLLYPVVHNETSYSKTRVNLFEGCNFFTILTDIVEPQYICASWKPAIRRFLHSNNSTNDKYTLKSFVPLYFPVVKDDFDSIQMEILGEDGKKICFETNEVVFLLHFREIKDE